MTRYAENTKVAPDTSRSEIERTLTRYGAKAFSYGWEGTRAMVAFEMQGRYFRITLPLPDRNSREFTHTPERDYERSPKAALAAWEQAIRQRWRALALWIKAVLEATESGIISLEEGLLPFILLPDRSTVGEFILPQVERAYQQGEMPVLLPYLEGH